MHDTSLYELIYDVVLCILTRHRHVKYLTPVLDMLYLTPDPRYLISDTGTWYVILDTWYMTLDNWHAITHLTCYHLVLTHLTWYCDTWLDTIIPDTCTALHIHDYHFYGDLAWLLYCYQIFCTPKLLCSWTLVYLNPEKGRLLIQYSCWSP